MGFSIRSLHDRFVVRKMGNFGPALIRNRYVLIPTTQTGSSTAQQVHIMLWSITPKLTIDPSHLLGLTPDEVARFWYLSHAVDADGQGTFIALAQKGQALFQAVADLHEWAETLVGETLPSPLLSQDLAHCEAAIWRVVPARMTDDNRKNLTGQWNRVVALTTEMDEMEAQALV